MQNLQLIVNIILTVTLISYIGVDIKKIKINKETIKKDNEILIAHKELKERLDLKNKIAKETQEEITKMKEYHKELKANVSLYYDIVQLKAKL